jgi:AraC-like DNA-binding protein
VTPEPGHPGLDFLRAPDGEWELIRRAPHPRLRGLVVGPYQGWIDHARRPLCRREVAGCLVPLIFDFGAPFLLARGSGPDTGPDTGAEIERRTSFVAGLWDGPALSQATGPTVAIQVNFTPLGASQVFGCPLVALANRVVAVEDVLGPTVLPFIDRLAETSSWSARFDLLDTFLAARVSRGRPPLPEIAWAWRTLSRTQGRAAIGTLARELGWSHRRLIAHWHGLFGLTPKVLARLLRFEGLLARLPTVEREGWAAVAADCGFADQSHLIRDCHAFAGASPRALLASRLGDGGGLDAGSLLAAP